MIPFILVTVYLSVTGLSEAIEVIKVDKSMVELRLVLNVETADTDPTDMTAVYVSRSLDKGLEIFQQKEYNSELPLIMVLHGFHGSADKHNPHLHAFVHNNYRDRFNIVALNMPLYFDWSAGNLWYLLPAMRAKFVGEVVGQLLNEAIDLGMLAADKINLIGFSLGAQMAGYIARSVKGEVNSILGLDPAGPGFDSKLVQYNLLMTHLSKSDARYVHVYHTNSNTFGTTQRFATADFTFNNGWHQPGCMTSYLIMCSHRRAFMVFTSMINNPGLFQARRCDNYWSFRSCRCRQNEVVDLSFPPDHSANGTYYISTKGEPTYGEGPLGAMCPQDRLVKEIKDGIVKQSPTLYETITKLKTVLLTWRTTAKVNVTTDSALNKTTEMTSEETYRDLVRAESDLVLGGFRHKVTSSADKILDKETEDSLDWFYNFATELVLTELLDF